MPAGDAEIGVRGNPAVEYRDIDGERAAVLGDARLRVLVGVDPVDPGRDRLNGLRDRRRRDDRGRRRGRWTIVPFRLLDTPFAPLLVLDFLALTRRMGGLNRDAVIAR